MLQYAILWLLHRERDYGYRLKRRFEERMGAVWPLNIGQVYQTLQKLERAGFVAEVRGAGQEHYPARRLFEITPKGLRSLERWLGRTPIRPRPVRDETLVRLLVIEEGRHSELVAKMDEQERHCRRHLTRLRERDVSPADGGDGALLVRHLGQAAERLYAEAHLRWLEYSRARLEQLAAGEGRASA